MNVMLQSAMKLLKPSNNYMQTLIQNSVGILNFPIHCVHSFRAILVNNFGYFPIQLLIELSANGVYSSRDTNSLLIFNLDKNLYLIFQYASKI
jgi:hypothetical protein